MIGQGVAVHFGSEYFNPSTPVSIPVHGFRPGQKLRLVLIPTGDHFAVNLKTPSDIAFHFNPRFNERAVVRNSTLHGNWQSEERWEQEFPFTQGRMYTLEFVSHPGSVEIMINGRPYCRFNERHSHEHVNLIEVGGPVHIHSIHVVN